MFYVVLDDISSVHFQAVMTKKLRHKCYCKWITTRDNGNIKSHAQKESKLNSTTNTNNDAHTLPHYIMIKSLFNKNTVATTKNN